MLVRHNDKSPYTGKEQEPKFDQWAILELMGHRRLAGRVTDAVIGGGAFLRIDIPTKKGELITQFYSPQAVYCISPTTEELARAVAYQSEPEPVHRWELPELNVGVAGTPADNFPYYDKDTEDREDDDGEGGSEENEDEDIT
jgi:hypothetical protein